MIRMTALAVLPVIAVAVAGCGGDSATSSESGSTLAAESVSPSPTLPSGTLRPAACGALTPEQAKAVTGAAATPTSPTNGLQASEAYGLDTCIWGDVTKGALALQVFTPGAVTNPLNLSLGNAAATPVPALPQGNLYRVGLLPGGGGVGITVTWQEGQSQVALSLLKSDTTPADEQALIAAAQQAEQVL